ncbi:MAG: NAD-dependent epimerase/dehydratase family protein [Gemmataceae bacterium]
MRILVTGGGGFLGSAICSMLVKRGDQVQSISRQAYPGLATMGISQFRGDLVDKGKIYSAAQGCDAIIHTAAKAGIWGDYSSYYQANVLGTQNIIEVCRELRITKLVYTSSPSVVFSGGDMEGVNESAPYPKRYLTAYPKTKAIAEQMVLNANDENLATVSLRPHLIWGPGDNHLVPRILARAKAGKLRKIGSRDVLVDSVYIDNAASAHILALDRLNFNSPCSGKAYFISNGEPWKLWDLVNEIILAGKGNVVNKTVSVSLAYFMGWLFEIIYTISRKHAEPPMTRFLAKELSTSHWFDISNARNDLGYVPMITIREGLDRLKMALSNH